MKLKFGNYEVRVYDSNGMSNKEIKQTVYKTLVKSCKAKDEKNPLDKFPDKELILEFNNGEYVHVGYEKGKIFAGGATNSGIFHDYELDYDWDKTPEENLQDLYDKIAQDMENKEVEDARKKDLVDVWTIRWGYMDKDGEPYNGTTVVRGETDVEKAKELVKHKHPKITSFSKPLEGNLGGEWADTIWAKSFEDACKAKKPIRKLDRFKK